MLSVILMLIMSRGILADYEHVCSPEKISEGPAYHGICGRRLADTRELVCSQSSVDRRSPAKDRTSGDDWLRRATLDEADAKSFLSKRPRGYPQYQVGETNIVCECCYNACSVREIDQYCFVPREKRDVKPFAPPLTPHAKYRKRKSLSGTKKWRNFFRDE